MLRVAENPYIEAISATLAYTKPKPMKQAMKPQIRPAVPPSINGVSRVLYLSSQCGCTAAGSRRMEFTMQ